MDREQIKQLRNELKAAGSNLWTAADVRGAFHARVDSLCDLALSALSAASGMPEEPARFLPFPSGDGSSAFMVSLPLGRFVQARAYDALRDYAIAQQAECARLRADLAAARGDAKLRAAIERAARDLPEGFEVEISVERGSGSVTLRDPHGGLRSMDGDADDRLTAEINAAIDAARKEAK